MNDAKFQHFVNYALESKNIDEAMKEFDIASYSDAMSMCQASCERAINEGIMEFECRQFQIVREINEYCIKLIAVICLIQIRERSIVSKMVEAINA